MNKMLIFWFSDEKTKYFLRVYFSVFAMFSEHFIEVFSRHTLACPKYVSLTTSSWIRWAVYGRTRDQAVSVFASSATSTCVHDRRRASAHPYSSTPAYASSQTSYRVCNLSYTRRVRLRQLSPDATRSR